MGNGDTQLFLVRVWQDLAQFRASVRGVTEEEPQLFTDPAQLAEFFGEVASATASGGDDDERS
jgi:hypothetical protein